ncbi:YbbR domain-containing protein [Virgibacillus subterraneus]|uniref:YbbR domain-containing protein n=1 Tax=Virgibacillus subterraneus TaxID=621109 RepID=A0A1H9I6F3_9BACI|nr:CdaR family protein [Virgibacillus subterraneus]SEQ70281.1 YbbR domain-containing protein [Virgibacillus subterraneus]
MDNWFKSRWFVRGISLFFAIVLYVFVQVEIGQYQNDSRIPNNNEGIQTIENVPVNIRIDEDNYVVSGVPEVATVSLEGPTGTTTAAARQQNFDVFVDLQNLEEGTHTVEMQHSGVPDELTVYIEPKTIEVIIEERASEQFDVAVDFINTEQLPEGFEVGESEVNPQTVTITSSSDVISKIAIVKVFVDVAELEENIDNREVPVNVYDASGNELNVRVEPESIAVSAEIQNPSKTVPVTLSTTGELPEGYSLSSISANVDEAEIFATSDVLQGIEEVSTEDIDLSEIDESGTINVGLALPNGANAPETEQVEVTIELEQTKTVEDVPIDVENLEEGQEVSFVEPAEPVMNITVVGNQSDVSQLTAEDFQVTVDAGGLESGEHQLPVTVEGPENSEVDGQFGQVTIEIT